MSCDKYHLPDHRKLSSTVLKDPPPHLDLKSLKIKTWIKGNVFKKDDLVDILRSSLPSRPLTHIQTNGSMSLWTVQLSRALQMLTTDFWFITLVTVYSIFTFSPVHVCTSLQLKVQNSLIQKDNNPSYLGVRLNPRLSQKAHFEDITSKVSKRLNLLKRLTSSNWGTNKNTLRQLYTGYIRAVFDYSAPLQATESWYIGNHWSNHHVLHIKQN